MVPASSPHQRRTTATIRRIRMGTPPAFCFILNTNNPKSAHTLPLSPQIPLSLFLSSLSVVQKTHIQKVDRSVHFTRGDIAHYERFVLLPISPLIFSPNKKTHRQSKRIWCFPSGD